jgi:hypothetical protein
MKSGGDPGEERLALHLSLREWLVVALLSTALVAVAPSVRFRPRAPLVDTDYRIPFVLSTRYEIYRRFTALAAAQFPTILVGDSVVWGQCATRNQTLSHHLNELTKQPRFANAGLDGMHPIALAELIEHHAPAIERKSVIVHLDPLWLMVRDQPAATAMPIGNYLFNRPGLVPRLAAGLSSSLKQSIAAAATHALRRSPLNEWAEHFSNTRVDFLAWSLDHPYESPLKAIAAALPPSEDSHALRLTPWKQKESELIDTGWPARLEEHPQWQAFVRLIALFELRSNRVLVLVGPMNEHMMTPATRSSYQGLKKVIREKLQERGIYSVVPPPLEIGNYGDICHPLGAGYEELARELLKNETSWLLGGDRYR